LFSPRPGGKVAALAACAASQFEETTMFLRRTLALAAAAAMTAITPALAAPAQASVDARTRADIRCIAALAAAGANAQNEQAKEIARLGVLYFMGRIDGRTPGIAMETVVPAEIRAMTLADIQAATPDCVSQLQARGATLDAIGAALNK
jgi:hypothetical protein